MTLWRSAGGGGLAARRAAAGEGARRRGAGGFMAVARAVARRRSRTITDGDNLGPTLVLLILYFFLFKDVYLF